MRRLFLLLIVTMTPTLRAEVNKQILECMSGIRDFRQLKFWQQDKLSRSGDVYVVPNWSPSIPRTVGLVLPSGLYRVQYTEQDQADSFSRKSDYIRLRITGLPEGELFISILDWDVARQLRYPVDAGGFGSSVIWGKYTDANFLSSQAIPLNSAESESLVHAIAKQAKEDVQNIGRGLSAQQMTLTSRIESLTSSIPRAEQRIRDLEQSKKQEQEKLPSLKASKERFAKKLEGQTDEDILIALKSRILEYELAIGSISSSIQKMEDDIKSEETMLAQYREAIMQNNTKLKAEAEEMKPKREQFQNQVISRCSPIPGIN